MRETAATLPTTAATVSLEDGAVYMSASDRDAELRVRRPEHPPLSASEPVATLVLAGDGLKVDVQLDTDGVTALRAALGEAVNEGVATDV